jgi:hypothetical protein
MGPPPSSFAAKAYLLLHGPDPMQDPTKYKIAGPFMPASASSPRLVVLPRPIPNTACQQAVTAESLNKMSVSLQRS